jgi:tetratricopeptide (TPR) repeat protein
VDPAAVSAFDAARRALAAGRTAEAERAFVALTRSHPELAGPHANLALIHRRAGRYAEAAAALERAVQLAPQRADLHNQLGITYRMAGQFAKARAAYERAIEVDPNYALAWLNLGILEDLYLWDRQRALALYERYLTLAPGGDDNVRKWVADLKNRMPQKSAVARKEQP